MFSRLIFSVAVLAATIGRAASTDDEFNPSEMISGIDKQVRNVTPSLYCPNGAPQSICAKERRSHVFSSGFNGSEYEYNYIDGSSKYCMAPDLDFGAGSYRFCGNEKSGWLEVLARGPRLDEIWLNMPRHDEACAQWGDIDGYTACEARKYYNMQNGLIPIDQAAGAVGMDVKPYE